MASRDDLFQLPDRLPTFREIRHTGMKQEVPTYRIAFSHRPGGEQQTFK